MMGRCQQLLSKTGQLHISDNKVQGNPHELSTSELYKIYK